MLYIVGDDKLLSHREHLHHVGDSLPEITDVTDLIADGHEKEALIEALKNMRTLKLEGAFAQEVYKEMKKLERLRKLREAREQQTS